MQEDQPMSPSLKNTSSKLEPIKFAVPIGSLEIAQKIIEEDQYNEASFHRDCWLAGLVGKIEASNKAQVNRKLRREASKDEYTPILEALASGDKDRAIALIQELK